MGKALGVFVIAMFSFGLIRFLIGIEEESTTDGLVEGLVRDLDIKEVMEEDRRGPANLERRFQTRDPVWKAPASKSWKFRGDRHGTYRYPGYETFKKL